MNESGGSNVRVSSEQADAIRQIVYEEAGKTARVRVFGSRLYDDRRGGDLDLLVELEEPVGNPALMSARIAARLTRLLNGREVDVILSAPNLRRLPIHETAEREGRLL